MDVQKIKLMSANLLSEAGISLNGSHPWDIQVHDDTFFQRVFADPEMEFGETYMDGLWDCGQLDEFFNRIFAAKLEQKIFNFAFFRAHLMAKIVFLKNSAFNLQNKTQALEVGKKHYDLGNELFERMLDQSMNYSCGYWRRAQTLEAAQTAKLDLVCQKLGLKPGMTLLDIGCGWGSLAKYAALNYGVSVTGVTISKEQFEYAKVNCAGLPVEIRFQDYRELDQPFDRIASIGMFEHVGYKNYLTYFETVHRCLKDEGIFILHTIGSNVTVTHVNPWISKYIFPNSMLPSIAQIARSSEKFLIMEDWHNFGADYDKTLMCWHQNFNQHWDELKNRYTERFRRMWNFYLLSSAGAFRQRGLQLWQVAFSKQGIAGGYLSIR